MMGNMVTNTPYHKTVFKSGTRLILVPMEGVNSVATCVMVEVGSRNETPEINGVSHFLEHMVFKGTKKYPTMDDVMFIERMGGLQNAYADIDITNYHNKLMASDWKAALELNKELALYPKLEEKYIEKERDVILEEMKRYNDDLPARVSEEFQKLLYKGTPLGMRVIGEEQSLRSSNAGTLKDYHDSLYTLSRMVVILAGNINDQSSEIKEVAEEWFGDQPQKSKHQTTHSTVVDRQDKPAVSIITKKDAEQAHLTLGLRTFARGSEERYAWSVFNLLFGVSFTSRLFKEIREKRGLCYAIRSGSDNWDDVGYWSIYAGVATGKVKEAVSAIITELQKAIDKGVTEEEVSVAKKRLLTMVSFKTEDPEFMAEFYGKQELHHLPILTIKDYFKKIESVTKGDIHKLIKKYVVEKYLNLAVVWNRPINEKLKDLLVL